MKKLRVGDWVEVRSKEEILSTLDKQGRLEGMPFMPQMFQYCGKKLQVYKSAHKTCDFIYTHQSRWLKNGIHLNLRCDGATYGGCQHSCLIYWKTAWLKRIDGQENAAELSLSPKKANCSEQDVLANTRSNNDQNETIYFCQGTEIPNFTTSLKWWDVRQYIKDYTSGNATLRRLFNGFVYGTFWSISNGGIKLGPATRWLYDQFDFIWGPYPRKYGSIPQGSQTPVADLNLQPGELVRVKSYNEILETLNVKGQNRGLQFDAEMVPYCGGIYRVRTRVTTFLDEKSRKIVSNKTPCIILENVFCQSRYSECKMICPRSIYSWWREIWLERVDEKQIGQ